MREIKFRAFDKTKQKWINGTDRNPLYIIGEHTMFDILNQYKIENFCDIEISQYTGLKDVNGIEIYEGDILFSKNKTLIFEYIVRWYEGRFIYCKSKRGIKKQLNSKDIYFKELEVIGNIFKI